MHVALRFNARHSVSVNYLVFKTGRSRCLSCTLSVTLTGAVAAGESISVRAVVLQRRCDRLSCGAGGRDASREGHGLQSVHVLHMQCQAMR